MFVHKRKLLCIPGFIAMTTVMGAATAAERIESHWTKVNKTDKFEVMLDEKSSGRFAFFFTYHATFKSIKPGGFFDGVNNKGQGTASLVNGNGPVSGFDISEKDGDTYKSEWSGECYSVTGPDGKPIGYCSGGGFIVPGSGTGRFAGLSGGGVWWGHALPDGDFQVEGVDFMEK